MTLGDDNLRVVDEPIDDRGRGRGVPEGLAPPAEGQVARHDHAGLHVALADELVEERGAIDVKGEIAELIADQERGFVYSRSAVSRRCSRCAWVSVAIKRAYPNNVRKMLYFG